jgi:hypothetical protein
MSRYIFTATALWIAIFLCGRSEAQEPAKIDRTYETAVAKAKAACAALWADHNLDPLRDNFPLGEDNEPTPAMLANPERLHPEEKPLADLAIKALGQCREAWAPAWAMLPPAVKLMTEGVQRKQDAVIADLYSGKITWGDFNATLDRLNGEFEQAVSDFSQQAQQPDATKFDQPTYQAALTKAQADCTALYADHAFDSLRDKLPLGRNPTYVMFADTERLSQRDKPVADLYVKTVKQCRVGFAAAVALLPKH